VNRAQRRAAQKQRAPRLSPVQKRRAAAYARQLFVWRYCENSWWRMSTGWSYRGIVPAAMKEEAHNLALVMDLRWQAVSITYLQDQWGKEYRQFGFARTQGTFKGYKQGICPLLDECLASAEEGLNAKHIYARGMVFAPYSEGFDSLLPVLSLKREQLRLTDQDLAAIGEEEAAAQGRSRQIHIPDPFDLDARIAQLLED
jgi:hypothetical protein